MAASTSCLVIFNSCLAAVTSFLVVFNSCFTAFTSILAFSSCALNLSAISSAVLLSNILNASENMLITSFGRVRYSRIFWRIGKSSGNNAASRLISSGVSAVKSERYISLSRLIFSVSLFSYCVSSQSISAESIRPSIMSEYLYFLNVSRLIRWYSCKSFMLISVLKTVFPTWKYNLLSFGLLSELLLFSKNMMVCTFFMFS